MRIANRLRTRLCRANELISIRTICLTVSAIPPRSISAGRRANAPVAAVGLALEQRVEDGFPVRKMLVRRPDRESGALRGGRILKRLLDNDKDLSSKCRAALQQPNR